MIKKVSEEALMKRFRQGWVSEIEKDIKKLIDRIVICKRDKIATSIAYHGNNFQNFKNNYCDLLSSC